MRSLHIRFNPAAKLNAIYFRHHYITDNQIRILINGTLLPFFSVRRFHDLIEVFQLLF